METWHFRDHSRKTSIPQREYQSSRSVITLTCFTILLLSLPYMRNNEPQFFTCGWSSWRIFWDANCFPTLLFLPALSQWKQKPEILSPRNQILGDWQYLQAWRRKLRLQSLLSFVKIPKQFWSCAFFYCLGLFSLISICFKVVPTLSLYALSYQGK